MGSGVGLIIPLRCLLLEGGGGGLPPVIGRNGALVQRLGSSQSGGILLACGLVIALRALIGGVGVSSALLLSVTQRPERLPCQLRPCLLALSDVTHGHLVIGLRALVGVSHVAHTRLDIWV